MDPMKVILSWEPVGRAQPVFRPAAPPAELRRLCSLLRRRKAPASLLTGALSLDLGFLELDVLAHLRVVFAEGHLLGDVPRILLRHIIEAGVGGADELDLDRGRLGHDSLSNSGFRKKIKRRPRRSHARPPLP